MSVISTQSALRYIVTEGVLVRAYTESVDTAGLRSLVDFDLFYCQRPLVSVAEKVGLRCRSRSAELGSRGFREYPIRMRHFDDVM